VKLASLSIQLPLYHAAFGDVFTRRHQPTFSVEGFTTSEMSRIMCEPEYRASQGSQGRKPSGEDISGVAVFLVTDAARYISGQTIHVNGGLIVVD